MHVKTTHVTPHRNNVSRSRPTRSTKTRRVHLETPQNTRLHTPKHTLCRRVHTPMQPPYTSYSSEWVGYREDFARRNHAVGPVSEEHGMLSQARHAVCARFAQVCARFYTQMRTSNTVRVRLHTLASYAFERIHTLKPRKHTLCTPLCTPKHASAHL